ncbi:hypothetical protein [Microcoleus sp. FACHB-672]|uniref:hypothetical protein n=1 Tax=Microcoleus sp. FACHB-672 TaxID=2692825 RepID=UPI001687E9A1|nr:hypothetical protein [Microcoleus sp. FACHB-672]MBD2043221.1 hypothetical protein [Microcoleus sp. FACHB-672]
MAIEETYSQQRLTLSCCDDYASDVWELPGLPRHCQAKEIWKDISLAGCKYQVTSAKRDLSKI